MLNRIGATGVQSIPFETKLDANNIYVYHDDASAPGKVLKRIVIIHPQNDQIGLVVDSMQNFGLVPVLNRLDASNAKWYYPKVENTGAFRKLSMDLKVESQLANHPDARIKNVINGIIAGEKKAGDAFISFGEVFLLAANYISLYPEPGGG